jgi:outer membrane protein assembly factor BamB
MSRILLLLISLPLAAADWPDYRGPRRDGTSPEKNLPERWSPAGENLAWKAPYGGRSTPIILGDRVYVFNPAGKDDNLRERLMCLDFDTGKVLWEHYSNVWHSDVPPHRVAWSSPAGDPETGNVYFFGVGGALKGLSPAGKVLWERSLAEEFGLVTTHGGRTVSPIVEGDQVIVSGITTGWGELARAGQRFMAFDKRTGETLWVAAHGGRPFDTVYSPGNIVEVNGVRMLIAGGSDGAVHALKLLTGEPVWKYVISKRGLNTGVVVYNNVAYVTQSEENLATSEMGLLAAVDATARGDITPAQVKWGKFGYQFGFSNPVMDGDRLFQIDNSSNLWAFDAVTGRDLWKKNLGTLQKGSPVLADGKIYVGTENGKVYILRPGNDGAAVLDVDDLAEDEIIYASPAISNGRVFIVSTNAIYAFGKKAGPAAKAAPSKPATPSADPPAFVQVVPTELLLKPGQSVAFKARLYDARGRFIRESPAKWETTLTGTVGADGKFVAGKAKGEAGFVTATVEGIKGTARARIIDPSALAEDFDALKPGPPPPHWINATGKYTVRAKEGGGNMLVKNADNAFTKRARSFFGHGDMHDYTVQAEVFAVERRRQMGDAGVVAQRYELVLFGNHQRLEIQPWQPEVTRTVKKDFPWKPNTWYRMKLRVDNLPDGKVRARGKAWPASEPEPAEWMIERVDPIGNRVGTPGIYADAPFEVFFDNIKVEPNS